MTFSELPTKSTFKIIPVAGGETYFKLSDIYGREEYNAVNIDTGELEHCASDQHVYGWREPINLDIPVNF